MPGRTEIVEWSMCICSPKGNIPYGGGWKGWVEAGMVGRVSPKSPERKTSFAWLRK